MASKKKLIQLSKTASILQNSRYVLFIQQTQKKNISNLKIDLGLDTKNNIRIFQYKNTIIQKFLADSPFLYNNDCIVSKSLDKSRAGVPTDKSRAGVPTDKSRAGVPNLGLDRKNINFLNLFQGPNMLLAGMDLNQLPAIWKALNSIPHLFFCGAIIDKTAYNHLDLKKGIECVYNTSSQEVYSRLLETLSPDSQLNELSDVLERKIENVWSALIQNQKK
uniref:Uncharacterized protein n=1 Tax=Auxenochlorella protothecoides TaxID=3075 RepID=A0A1Z1GBL3_AUXPR|nr:hypothetical protein BW920_0097 [Auxenochlorella protothecoides]